MTPRDGPGKAKTLPWGLLWSVAEAGSERTFLGVRSERHSAVLIAWHSESAPLELAPPLPRRPSTRMKIELSDVNKRFGQTVALDHVRLEFEPGQIIAL